jgi:UDP-N-acetyl-D-galactosamine dehydrogenase
LQVNPRIAVIGLGYVGLPLSLALSRHFHVIGCDANDRRREELQSGIDSTGETSADVLAECDLKIADDLADIRDCNIYIVTVPTPIDDKNTPDLTLIESACRSIGGMLSAGDTVVFESTVYPGVTEDYCGPILAEVSGLRCGDEFFLGYSPERINPGDDRYSIEAVCKVVAGQTPEVAAILRDIYSKAVPAGVHLAPSIKVAEAAKVIENAQRDINIAFINEVAMIFQKMDIDTGAVLAAARTKWNFLDFQPGLVGGHCIGVDPYYLSHAAEQVGHNPEVILAGRRINDAMSEFVADRIASMVPKSARILVLGLAFKENVSDLRNSKVADLVRLMKSQGLSVTVHDARVDPEQAKQFYDIEVIRDFDQCQDFDAVVGAVAHHEYALLGKAALLRMVRAEGVLADLKGIWRNYDFPPPIRYWQL